jgi:hypothetical protein
MDGSADGRCHESCMQRQSLPFLLASLVCISRSSLNFKAYINLIKHWLSQRLFPVTIFLHRLVTCTCKQTKQEHKIMMCPPLLDQRAAGFVASGSSRQQLPSAHRPCAMEKRECSSEVCTRLEDIVRYFFSSMVDSIIFGLVHHTHRNFVVERLCAFCYAEAGCNTA